MKIKFLKFNDNVKKPERKHYSDTGADVFLLDEVRLDAHETKIVPLGFGLDIPNGYTAKLQVRTSIARRGVLVQQCAIDAGYKGEIHMIVVNLNDYPELFEKGERLGYIEVYPCVYPDFVDELGDERNVGSFGSTGK